MLVILLIRGLSLAAAVQGVVYHLYPDVSHLRDLKTKQRIVEEIHNIALMTSVQFFFNQVWMDACSQVLFSFGVSAGTLIPFGSHSIFSQV